MGEGSHPPELGGSVGTPTPWGGGGGSEKWWSGGLCVTENFRLTLGSGGGGSGGSSPPLPSPLYPYDAPAGAQCAECTQPVLFKYDAESSIGAV